MELPHSKSMTGTNIPPGEFIADHLTIDGEPLTQMTDEQHRIQPNGVDIGIAQLFRLSGRAVFKPDGDYDRTDRMKVTPKPVPAHDELVYSLPAGSYSVIYDVVIEIPDGYTGHVYPRSRLMRCGCHLTTALWDQGYEGVGEGLLQIPRGIERVTIPETMPVAQMTFQPAADADSYEGTHQGERLAEEDARN